jgi:hypothetical protein
MTEQQLSDAHGERVNAHTPGPLTYNEWACYPRKNEDGNRYWGIAPVTFARGAEYLEASGWMLEGNARLLAAAYTSYDKHCGPNAIACAEGDLLGEALELIRDAEESFTADDSYQMLRIACRAILAKAAGK